MNLVEGDNNFWPAQAKDDRHSTYCKVCSCRFSIASIRKAALRSHKNRSSHMKCIKDQSQTIPTFLHMPRPSSSTSSSTTPVIQTSVTMPSLSVSASSGSSSVSASSSGSCVSAVVGAVVLEVDQVYICTISLLYQRKLLMQNCSVL